MLNTTFAVTGKTVVHAGVLYTIKAVGIRDDEPFAEVDPPSATVTETIVRHVRKSMPLPFSLDEVQRELA